MKLKGLILSSLVVVSAALAAAGMAIGAATATEPGPAAPSAASLPTGSPIAFGMDASSVSAQANAGVKPDYGTFWIGPWTLSSGWGGPDAQMASLAAAGVTPAIHFYYWGDDITPSCVENGCWSSLHDAQKDRAGWERLGNQLVDHLKAKMAGKPAVVFLESEFNKGGIQTYEPFDGYMADMAAKIHAGYPQAVVVLGFGNWGSNYWGNFDRAAAASDMVGIQGMRGSTRQTETQMYSLYDGLLAGSKTLAATFPGKPIMLTDIAVSSYPEPDYLAVQEGVLTEVFANMATLKGLGVEAMIYRSWRDSPGMDLANYYGEAERHWGLAWSGSGALKPAGQVWIDGVKAERAGVAPEPAPSPAPAPAPAPPIAAVAGTVTEVESFAARSAGGRQADAAASGAAMWNLWSNGAATQTYALAGPLDLTVRARGTTYNGVGPHMDVYVAGAKVLSADPGTTYSDRTVRVNATGDVEVRIAFTNDAAGSGQDRNLILDTVRFSAPNQAPVAAFSATPAGLSVLVDAAASSDPDGDALTTAIAFGDGATAAGPTATHTYATPGAYTVTVTVSDGRATATATRSVTAVQPNRAPVAALSAAMAGLTGSFDASASSDADGDALTYAWSFGDGATASGRTATHTYAAGGTYTVGLTVSDGALASSAQTAVVATAPAPFTATLTPKSSSNEWWVEVVASGSKPISTVQISVAGGAWTTLSKTSWGTYAKGMHITQGTMVQLRATATDGQVATGTSFPWLGAAPAPAPAPTPATKFTATFTPKSVGNDWWVETAVASSSKVTKVEAKLGSGAWTVLPKDAWGTYAKSLHASDGTPIVFRATNSAGQTVTSQTVIWR